MSEKDLESKQIVLDLILAPFNLLRAVEHKSYAEEVCLLRLQQAIHHLFEEIQTIRKQREKEMEGQDCCEEIKPNTLTEDCIESCVAGEEYCKLGVKTTCCLITLKNGFEVCGTAACVDPSNYNHEIGCQMAREKAVSKVWELEGYKLQCQGAC